MLARVKMWWTTCSLGLRLILTMLVASGLGMLALATSRKRGMTADSRRTSLRTQRLEEVNEAGGKVAVHHERASAHIEQAENLEVQAGALDLRLQAARERIAELKKELGR